MHKSASENVGIAFFEALLLLLGLLIVLLQRLNLELRWTAEFLVRSKVRRRAIRELRRARRWTIELSLWSNGRRQLLIWIQEILRRSGTRWQVLCLWSLKVLSEVRIERLLSVRESNLLRLLLLLILERVIVKWLLVLIEVSWHSGSLRRSQQRLLLLLKQLRRGESRWLTKLRLAKNVRLLLEGILRLIVLQGNLRRAEVWRPLLLTFGESWTSLTS